MAVVELTDQLEISQQAVSQHLAVLDRAGLVEAHKDGTRSELPVGLTTTFSADAMKAAQWSAFLGRAGARDVGKLEQAVEEIARFVQQPLQELPVDPRVEKRLSLALGHSPTVSATEQWPRRSTPRARD